MKKKSKTQKDVNLTCKTNKGKPKNCAHKNHKPEDQVNGHMQKKEK